MRALTDQKTRYQIDWDSICVGDDKFLSLDDPFLTYGREANSSSASAGRCRSISFEVCRSEGMACKLFLFLLLVLPYQALAAEFACAALESSAQQAVQTAEHLSALVIFAQFADENAGNSAPPWRTIFSTMSCPAVLPTSTAKCRPAGSTSMAKCCLGAIALATMPRPIWPRFQEAWANSALQLGGPHRSGCRRRFRPL